MIHIPDSIYPKDAQGQPLCPRCKNPIKACDCPSLEPAKPKPVKVLPKIRLEKNGRKGKIVTLVEGLLPSEIYLKGLSKTLKTSTGSGGTYYISENSGVVEIQGDHKKAIEKFFNDLI
jgi:translation initiation factor 1